MKKLLCLALLLVACKKDAKPKLGEPCTRDEDCQNSLACGFRLDRSHPEYEKLRLLDAPASVCVDTRACKQDDECSRFGPNATCAVVGVCVLSCKQDSDCPAQTYCYEKRFCTR
ncbi:MAG: hypothetical protein AB7T06_34625 [Kofleriaceae bacterium]